MGKVHKEETKGSKEEPKGLVAVEVSGEKRVILVVVPALVLIPLSSSTVGYLKLIDFDRRRLRPIRMSS
jgi:hypothetical protein